MDKCGMLFGVAAGNGGAAGPGAVWLRARAVDTAGNQVDQTIIRAYLVG
jgi:hypothetical protein